MVIIELYAALYIGLMVFSLIAFLFFEKQPSAELSTRCPLVTILIAARNEEQHIARCIHSIKALHYAADCIEVLIGDDQSTDSTYTCAVEAIGSDTRFQIHRIEGNIGMARGKANVLAQLAQRATGTILFITDADIQVNQKWIETLLNEFEDDTHIVSGSTLINDGSWQDLDWRYFTMVLQAMANLGIGGTAVGNNMAIRTATYKAIGGYENIPFSIVEDFALFKTVQKNGYGWKNIYTKNSLNYTYPAVNLKQLLSQRKRWALGGFRGFSLFWKSLFGVFGLYPIALFALLLMNPLMALSLFVIRAILQIMIHLILASRLQLNIRWKSLLTYDIYHLIFNSLLAFVFLAPGVEWKNRKYQ